MRLLFAAPLLILLVLFTLSNSQHVRLGLWPTDFALEAPLSIVVLLAMAVAFLCGALLLWFSAMGARHRARRAEYAARLAEEQIRELQARLLATTPELPAPPPG